MRHGRQADALDALREEIVRFRAASDPAGRGASAASKRTVPARRVSAGAAPITSRRDLAPSDTRRASVPAQPVVPPREALPPGEALPSQGAGPPRAAVPAEGDLEALAIIDRAKAGDPEAFGELYDRNVDTVYRYVYYRVGNVALAEDLVSETFLRALRRIDTFTYQGRDVAAWFITIARNLIADHFKSSRYRLELTTEDMVTTTGDRVLDEDPAAQVLQAMANKALVAAVKQLGSEQQECIVLRFLQGMSVSETAVAMGKNEGSIKALQYRAVRALARLLPPGSV